MGRNFPSATELAHQAIGGLLHIGEMLSPQDRHVLNQFADFALNNHAAIANAAGCKPRDRAAASPAGRAQEPAAHGA